MMDFLSLIPSHISRRIELDLSRPQSIRSGQALYDCILGLNNLIGEKDGQIPQAWTSKGP